MLNERDIHRVIGGMAVQEQWNRETDERNWRLELQRPLPKINEPLKRCRVLAPFNLGMPTHSPSRLAVVDELVELPGTLVGDLVARGLVERL